MLTQKLQTQRIAVSVLFFSRRNVLMQPGTARLSTRAHTGKFLHSWYDVALDIACPFRVSVKIKIVDLVKKRP
ncbi:hypothetical protein K239x_12120 [Planctomycetes bacterium K23_9]|uniref:Uncharacterized protein n=1 Tax=Stieleria marina TaxID=1930275 RepID=A0A517NQ73_9BACT|nr:hypothetical protein K239x_12120 [Planctomycetes bacterium K23_9]